MHFTRGLVVLLAVFLLFSSGTAFSSRGVFHGLVSQSYLKSSDNNYMAKTEDGSFQCHEVILNYLERKSPKFRYGAQILARELGRDGKMAPTLDWAYGDYQFNQDFGFRFGRVKSPGGLHNQVRDIDPVRPTAFLPQAVYNEDLRDIVSALNGGALYGRLKLSSFGELDGQYICGTNSLSNDSSYVLGFMHDMSGQLMPTLGAGIANAVLGGLPVAVGANLLNQMMAALPSTGFDRKADLGMVNAFHFEWRPKLEGLRLAYTQAKTDLNWKGKFMTGLAAVGFPSVLSVDVDMDIAPYSVFGAEFAKNNWTFTYETLKADLKLKPATGGPSTKLVSGGYYGQVAYRFNNHWEAAGYVSKYTADKNDPGGKKYMAGGLPGYYGWQKDNCLAIRWDINQSWSVKLEYHDMNGTAACYRFYNKGTMKENWNMVALKTTYNF